MTHSDDESYWVEDRDDVTRIRYANLANKRFRQSSGLLLYLFYVLDCFQVASIESTLGKEHFDDDDEHKIVPVEFMMKSIIAGESDHSSPSVWHRKEDLQCGVVPDLYIYNKVMSYGNTNCVLPPLVWEIWTLRNSVCSVASWCFYTESFWSGRNIYVFQSLPIHCVSINFTPFLFAL